MEHKVLITGSCPEQISLTQSQPLEMREAFMESMGRTYIPAHAAAEAECINYEWWKSRAEASNGCATNNLLQIHS